MKKSAKTSPAKSFARAFLEEVLNRTAPGKRLPGMRELIQSSGVGRIRLEHILKEFEERNLIEVRDRSGRYRSAGNTISPVTFIHFSHLPVIESSSDFIGGTVQYLRNAAAEEGNDFQIINALNLELNELLELLKKGNIKQAFVFGAQDANVIKTIRKYVPFTISLLPHYMEVLGSELRDSPDMTSMQLKYLFQFGYRRIGYIHNVEENWARSPVQLHRLLDYYRIMAEQGYKIEPEWVFYCGYNWEHFNSKMYKLMCSSRRIEALIVTGSTLKHIYKYCANNGIAIGKELAVMGCDDIAPDLLPRVTTVTNTPAEIGEQAWQIMLNCRRGINDSEFTRLRIVTGKTVLHRNN